MFFLRSNEFWFSVSSLVLMRGGRVWSPVRCGVRGFSKIHHVGILPLTMPPNDFSSQLSSHLSSYQWAKLFSLFPFFPPPDDVRGLTRVQSPLTSSLSLSPDNQLYLQTLHSNTPEMIETKQPANHWSAWTSSSPSAFQVREKPGMFYTSSSQWLGGLMDLIHAKRCSCHLVHPHVESFQMLCKSPAGVLCLHTDSCLAAVCRPPLVLAFDQRKV